MFFKQGIYGSGSSLRALNNHSPLRGWQQATILWSASLSKVHFDMVKCISAMIPQRYTTVPADKEIRRKVDEEQFNAAYSAVVPAL